jgi:hypothetical protein
MDEQRCNDTFALIINFLTLDWEPKLVTIGLFEAKGTSRVSLAGRLQVFLRSKNLLTRSFTMRNMKTQLIYNDQCF